MSQRVALRAVRLLAHPAGHSLSPVMHNAAFTALGLPLRYEAVDVPPAGLPDAVAALRADGVAGANVSVPHKEAVARLVDALSPAAAALGAVNTVTNQGGRLVGSNTDGGGFLRGLAEVAPELSAGGFRALVLGAGGSARAVAWALAAAGSHVVVVNRRPERSEQLVAQLEGAGVGRGSVAPAPAGGVGSGYDLVVNCTSVGMVGGPAPADLPLLTRHELEGLGSRVVVSDLVYRPSVTPLLALAAELGLRHQNGVAMLVHQGALAFETWTGVAAPVEIMRRAVDAALSHRS